MWKEYSLMATVNELVRDADKLKEIEDLLEIYRAFHQEAMTRMFFVQYDRIQERYGKVSG
jgi:cell fate (sporulation/competence/biofilm development) regulator YlbF (YheA/YmcA/DUF963 family)